MKVAKEGGKEERKKGGSGKSGICPFNEVLARFLARGRHVDDGGAKGTCRSLQGVGWVGSHVNVSLAVIEESDLIRS